MNNLQLIKVKSIRYVWIEPTYDIEMKKNHNFFANGVVTHNSHSAAYWKLAWIGGYYKANYPLEFYCGMLQTLGQVSGKVERTEKDKVFMLLSDYKNHGYKLLYPDINRSGITFSIDKDENGKEFIRVGFNYIKGVGEKQAVEIVKKQPYTDYYDFLKKVDRRIVNSKVIQIIKQLGLFNSIWGAPDIDEKLVPEVNSIELIRELSLKLLEVLKDIRQWKESTDNILEEERKSNSLIELYDLIGGDEEKKYLETDLKEINYSDIKKIVNKIKVKLKSLCDKIEKKKVFYDQLWVYLDEGIKLKESIDSCLKYIEDEFKILTKTKIKRPKDKQLTIWSKDRHRLFEDRYSQDLDLIDFIAKLDKLEDLSLQEIAEIEWIKSNYFEVILATLILEPELQSIIQYIDKIITKIDLDKTCVEIHPSISYIMKTCSILLNVDLKEYASIIPILNRFIPLKYITFKDDIKYATSIWVIMDKVILNDQMKEDKSWINYNKAKVKASIMIGDLKLPMFINWYTYIKNKLVLDEIQPGDPIIIKFNISQWFKMIQVLDIIKAEIFKQKVDNKIPFDEKEQKFLKQIT